MPDWSKTHRGFAHLRLRFASVLSLLKLLSRRFCSSYSFRSFCYQHDDHTRLTRNQSFICSFELSVVNVSVAENHFKMLRFNRQTKDVGESWTLVLFAYSVQEPLFSSSELCISADGCRWTAVKFADCPVIIDFVVNCTCCETIWQEKERGCCWGWTLQTRKVRRRHKYWQMLANWPVGAMRCIACLLPTLFSYILFGLISSDGALQKGKHTETWTWWTQTGCLPFLRQSSIAVVFPVF